MYLTVKVVELVGESKNNWQEAVETAVKDASMTIRNITGVEVRNTTANVENGEIVDYRANVAVAFKVDDTE